MTIYPSGIKFPFEFVAAGGVGKADNGDKVMSNLKALILSKINERLIRKNVGTIGYTRVFKSARATTLEPIKHLIRQAIVKFEPRAAGITIDFRLQDDSEGSKVIADVAFIFKNTGEPVKMSLELN
jgi:phage baseplate assembly protein W